MAYTTISPCNRILYKIGYNFSSLENEAGPAFALLANNKPCYMDWNPTYYFDDGYGNPGFILARSEFRDKVDIYESYLSNYCKFTETSGTRTYTALKYLNDHNIKNCYVFSKPTTELNFITNLQTIECLQITTKVWNVSEGIRQIRFLDTNSLSNPLLSFYLTDSSGTSAREINHWFSTTGWGHITPTHVVEEDLSIFKPTADGTSLYKAVMTITRKAWTSAGHLSTGDVCDIQIEVCYDLQSSSRLISRYYFESVSLPSFNFSNLILGYGSDEGADSRMVFLTNYYNYDNN